MYKLTVYKYVTFRSATETASRFHILLDHLQASAARNGYEVGFDESDEGELIKDGQAVAGWHIVRV